MANSTVLNPDYMTSEIDRLDISLLVEESLDEEVSEDELSLESRTAIVDNIDRIEPLLKQEVNAAVYSIYDYLLGKKQELELTLTLRNTVFSTDFIKSIADKVDLSYFVTEFIIERL